MYSLFELMTLEGWEEVGRPLVTAQPLMSIFLLLFILVFTFGLLNMVVAMVVGKTLLESRAMEQLTDAEKKQQIAKEVSFVKTLFHERDEEGNLVVTWDDFMHMVKANPDVVQCFRRIGIPTKDLRALFQILDHDSSGTITIKELLGVLHVSVA